MGLFTQKAKKSSTTMTAKCPVCGKEHTATVYSCEAYYLDGTPQLTFAEGISQYVECDCGWLVDVTYPFILDASRVETCKTAAAKEYSDKNTRFLALLMAQTADEQTWLHARYYHEQSQADNLQKHLEERLNTLSRYGMEMGNGSLPQIKLTSKFIFNEKYERVDLLRRLGRFDEATKCIHELREAKYYSTPYELFDFLKFEEKLIKRKDTAQH